MRPARFGPARASRAARSTRGGQRARCEAQLLAQALVAEQRLEQRLERRVVDLAREVLEEAFELVAVAVGGGQEAGRVGRLANRALDRSKLDLQLVAKALHAPAHAHELAALEAPGEQVGLTEGARHDRAGAVAQLERQVGSACARDLALLARAREHGVDLVVAAQRGDGLLRGAGRVVAE